MADNISKYNNSLTAAERRKHTQAAGVKSGESRRENKIIKAHITDRMSDDDLTEIVDNLIDRAKHNTRDFIVLRDTLGQKPPTHATIENDPTEFHVIRVHLDDGSDDEIDD